MSKRNIWLIEVKTTFLDSLIFVLLTVALLFIAEGKVRAHLLDNVVTESLGLNSFTYTFYASATLIGIVFCLFGPFIGGKISGIDESIKLSPAFKKSPPNNPFNLNFILYKYAVHPITMLNISFGIGSLGVILGLFIVSLTSETTYKEALVFFIGYIMLFLMVLASSMLKYFWHGSECFFRQFVKSDNKYLSSRATKMFRLLAFILAAYFIYAFYQSVVLPLQKLNEESVVNISENK
jgi:hypothetical protein|tara:strand:+ start:10461 stop:11171 length:711 start_codon:yes stop_codon:yes gene_type:complete